MKDIVQMLTEAYMQSERKLRSVVKENCELKDKLNALEREMRMQQKTVKRPVLSCKKIGSDLWMMHDQAGRCTCHSSTDPRSECPFLKGGDS